MCLTNVFNRLFSHHCHRRHSRSAAEPRWPGGRVSIINDRRAQALRIAANTRWSRAHENGKCTGETQLAAPSWMGRARSMVDALRGLELDLACNQNRPPRFAAGFV